MATTDLTDGELAILRKTLSIGTTGSQVFRNYYCAHDDTLGRELCDQLVTRGYMTAGLVFPLYRYYSATQAGVVAAMAGTPKGIGVCTCCAHKFDQAYSSDALCGDCRAEWAAEKPLDVGSEESVND